MRRCRNCRQFNIGWPFRCRYCGAGLDGRLCPSGHVNPTDATLVFCGECGKPLEKNWGAGCSAVPYLLGLGVLMLAVVLAAIWLLVSPFEPVLNALVVLAILILGVRVASSIVPPWMRSLISDLLSFLFSALRYALGVGGKGGGKK
jgi:hypothetical protein